MNLPEPKMLTHQFLQTMRMRNCSERTIQAWTYILNRFVSWCNERSITCMSEINEEHVAAYRRSLFHYRNPKTGKPLTFDTQAHYLIPIRRWFDWMKAQSFIEVDPTKDIELPKSEDRLPTSILTADQVETLLNVPDVKTSAWSSRPGDPGNVLQQRDPLRRTDRAGCLRHQFRTWNSDCSLWQEQKGSRRSDWRRGHYRGSKNGPTTFVLTC